VSDRPIIRVQHIVKSFGTVMAVRRRVPGSRSISRCCWAWVSSSWLSGRGGSRESRL